jgi:uncharacterized repeat protein (TIGR01451 family)
MAAAAGLLACAALLLIASRAAWAAPAAAVRPYPGAAPCNTGLQACLDGANDGDTIVIAAGTYLTSCTLNKPVSLTGVSSATVILHALPSSRVLTVTGASISNTVVISGLTFTGGHVTGGGCLAGGCGGGILVDHDAQPLFVNIIITGNRATLGGGLFSGGGIQLRMTNSQVLSNTALGMGGGAFAGGPAALTGGLFQNNECTQVDCLGGGLYANDGLTLTGTQFISNSARSHGGGAYAAGTASLDGGLFQGNACTAAGCFGGGLWAADSLLLTTTHFIRNSAALHGGGLRAGALTLSGTEFISNTASTNGGGAYSSGEVGVSGGLFQGNACVEEFCYGGGLFANGDLTLTGTQFIGNHARQGGGGVLAASAAVLNSGLFQANASTQGTGGGLHVAGALALTGTQFIGNAAAGSGGGVHFNGPTGRLVNSLFAANAAGSGSALYVNSTGSVSLLHSTLAAPSPVVTPAVHLIAGSLLVTNTLFANHDTAIHMAGGSAAEDFNLFSGVVTPTSGGVSSGGHSLTGAAGFADPAGGGYHLTPASDAIDAGTDLGIGVDFEGQPRPLGLGFDIGHDEMWSSDLGVSKTAGQDTARPGDPLTYTIVVTNTGPEPAHAVLVSDSLPASLTGATWTCIGSGGATCPAGGAGSISALVTVTAGGRVMFTLQATVDANASGAITNTAALLLPASMQDPTSADLSASHVTTMIEYRTFLPLVLRE